MTKVEKLLQELDIKYKKIWSETFGTHIETSKAIIEVHYNKYLSEKYIVNDVDTPSIYIKDVIEFLHN